MHIYTAHASPDLVRTGSARISSLTEQSRGRGCWDCVRQMQMYRRRPDVLAAALRDMGVLPDGHYEGSEPDGPSENEHVENQRDVSLN
jgi:hypothetical protein